MIEPQCLESIRTALDELRIGRFVILTDSPEREDEADLVLAAEHATAEAINFVLTYARGTLSLALTPQRASELELNLLPQRYCRPHAPNFTEPIDAVKGTTTGVSAPDRARTIQLACEPTARAEDFARPGHVPVLVAHPDGLRGRRGHTEAALALMELAGLRPFAVICEMMDDEGEMLRGEGLHDFARRHGLTIVHEAELLSA